MDLHLSREQEMLRKMYRDFAENEVKPLAEWVDENEAAHTECQTPENSPWLRHYRIPVHPQPYLRLQDGSEPEFCLP